MLGRGDNRGILMGAKLSWPCRYIRKSQTRSRESFLGASGLWRYARITRRLQAPSEKVDATG